MSTRTRPELRAEQAVPGVAIRIHVARWKAAFLDIGAAAFSPARYALQAELLTIGTFAVYGGHST